MGDFGENFAQGLQVGSALVNNAERLKRDTEDQDWKRQDRERENKNRMSADEFADAEKRIAIGDFSPVLSKVNGFLTSNTPDGQPKRFAKSIDQDQNGNFFATIADDQGNQQQMPLGDANSFAQKRFVMFAPADTLHKVMSQGQSAYAQTAGAYAADPSRQAHTQAVLQDVGQKSALFPAKAREANAGADAAETAARYGQDTLSDRVRLARGQADYTQAQVDEMNAPREETGYVTPDGVYFPAATIASAAAQDMTPLSEYIKSNGLLPKRFALSKSGRRIGEAAPDTPAAPTSALGVAPAPSSSPAPTSALGLPAPSGVASSAPPPSSGATVSVPPGTKDGLYNVGGRKVKVKGGVGMVVN